MTLMFEVLDVTAGWTIDVEQTLAQNLRVNVSLCELRVIAGAVIDVLVGCCRYVPCANTVVNMVLCVDCERLQVSDLAAKGG
jgi:hypothetical protein